IAGFTGVQRCLSPTKETHVASVTTRKGKYMTISLKRMIPAAVACLLALPASTQNTQAQFTTQQAVPAWAQRARPSEGHAALEPLIGAWRVHKSIYGTMGRSPDLPPIVSDEITTTREWVADHRYIQDTTTGSVEGKPYWRRGWLRSANKD